MRSKKTGIVTAFAAFAGLLLFAAEPAHATFWCDGYGHRGAAYGYYGMATGAGSGRRYGYYGAGIGVGRRYGYYGAGVGRRYGYRAGVGVGRR